MKRKVRKSTYVFLFKVSVFIKWRKLISKMLFKNWRLTFKIHSTAHLTFWRHKSTHSSPYFASPKCLSFSLFPFFYLSLLMIWRQRGIPSRLVEGKTDIVFMQFLAFFCQRLISNFSWIFLREIVFKNVCKWISY